MLKEWMDQDELVSQAAVHNLVSIGVGMDIDAAESHGILLAPVMKHLGISLAHPGQLHSLKVTTGRVGGRTTNSLCSQMLRTEAMYSGSHGLGSLHVYELQAVWEEGSLE